MKLGSGQYFGETLDSISVSGLVLTEKIHSPGEVLPEHYHENAYFCLALKGGWSELAEGRSFDCTVNNVVYHPKEEIHQTFFARQQHSKTFNVEITPSWFEKAALLDTEPLRRRVERKDRSLTGYLNSIYAEFGRNDRLSGLAIESHFIALFVHLSRCCNQQEKEKKQLGLHDVKEVLTTTYLNPLSLPELAKMFQVHPVYLSKSFKKKFGLTITDYYRKCRIDAACDMLKDSKCSLVEIALECGFYDQSHFCKYFLAMMGMTPLAYRKNPLQQPPILLP
jgi:AraC family transcriptional regulator